MSEGLQTPPEVNQTKASKKMKGSVEKEE